MFKTRIVPISLEPRGRPDSKYHHVWRQLVASLPMALAMMDEDPKEVERLYHALLKRAQRSGYKLRREKEESGVVKMWLEEERIGECLNG